MSTFEVEAPDGRFDLALSVLSGQTFRWILSDAGRWIGVDGDRWYAVRTLDDQRFEVESNVGKTEFERYFQLEVDAKIQGMMISAVAPEMTPFLKRMPGLRLLRPECPREVLFSFLCTPNNNLERITKMVRALAAYGPKVGEADGVVVHAFPSIERLAGVAESELREQRFGYRAGTIVSAARKLVDGGDEWLHSLKRCGYRQAFGALQGIPGVGPKVADCVALFGLHYDEAAPIDTHLWQSFVRIYKPEWAGKSLTEARYREVSEWLRAKFGPRTGWAQQFLFYDNVLALRNKARHGTRHGSTMRGAR